MYILILRTRQQVKPSLQPACPSMYTVPICRDNKKDPAYRHAWSVCTCAMKYELSFPEGFVPRHIYIVFDQEGMPTSATIHTPCQLCRGRIICQDRKMRWSEKEVACMHFECRINQVQGYHNAEKGKRGRKGNLDMCQMRKLDTATATTECGNRKGRKMPRQR